MHFYSARKKFPKVPKMRLSKSFGNEISGNLVQLFLLCKEENIATLQCILPEFFFVDYIVKLFT